MTSWIIKGLSTGIVTTNYPEREETAPGISPGLPTDRPLAPRTKTTDLEQCPAGALYETKSHLCVDYRRCIHCFRCAQREEKTSVWRDGYEWAFRTRGVASEDSPLGRAFHSSLHIRVIDAGACGACMSEIEQLNKPYYNIHRLGFFLTPTPREADVLLVAGPVTDHMRMPLLKAYEAMPTPKKVMAVGSCALSGGIFGPSFASGSGVPEILPVDVSIPGCPPPPLAIIHGLLVLVGRKAPAERPAENTLSGGKAHA